MSCTVDFRGLQPWGLEVVSDSLVFDLRRTRVPLPSSGAISASVPEKGIATHTVSFQGPQSLPLGFPGFSFAS